jgi:plastocyanin
MITRPLLLLLALAALLPAASAHATIRVVHQTGLVFVPANLTIVNGDTVRWAWSAGIHTVTNGTTLADPSLASLFDSPLTTASRSLWLVVRDGREDSGRVVASGVYACRLNAGGQATLRTMTLIK